MFAGGVIVITKDNIIEKKKVWLKSTEVIKDISHYNEVKVLPKITYAANGGNSRHYLCLILKKEGSSDCYNSFSLTGNPLLLEEYFRCYYKKKEIKDFKQVISFLSKNNARKVSYDEVAPSWFE